MKRFTQLLCFLSLALSIHAANAATNAGLTEVRDLGRINGQALACGYPDAAARVKAAMIQHAPKSRQYGTAFEETTNESFLTQSRQAQTTCPDGPTLNAQIDDATQRLQAAIPASAPKP